MIASNDDHNYYLLSQKNERLTATLSISSALETWMQISTIVVVVDSSLQTFSTAVVVVDNFSAAVTLHHQSMIIYAEVALVTEVFLSQQGCALLKSENMASFFKTHTSPS